MKLKIVEPGWESFSGTLGVVQFAEGVSVSDVSRVEANIISANIRVVDFEDDSSVGAFGLTADMQSTPCVTVTYPTMDQILSGQASGERVSEVVSVETAAVKTYTKEELEVVADKQGIAGLRVIGDALDVKGASIVGLIDAILTKQSPSQPEAAPLQEGQSVETKEQAQ